MRQLISFLSPLSLSFFKCEFLPLSPLPTLTRTHTHTLTQDLNTSFPWYRPGAVSLLVSNISEQKYLGDGDPLQSN